ncbi:ribosome biogenesis [Lecanosticta acicola]|uniref:Ribosome biogenesis n=1 Tax=Lecanosticta acicola TaxID=111012 RepID=A0AAI8Z6V1_9PEZI|nr:ribosome biogenesis [Lecanosticta acicola]
MAHAPKSTALATKATETTVAKSDSKSPYQLDSAQTLRASTALLKKIQKDEEAKTSTAEKTNLLADVDDEEPEDETPIWLILTTKKHIVDKKRLKPGKIVLPNPWLGKDKEGLRICLIAADPQRRYKELIAQPGFPLDLAGKIGRVIGMEKLKSKYKSYESRRQLLGEYDVFLADDRVITYLPKVLGKVFYKGGSKRPVPVNLEGKKQNFDETAGEKRKKLSEGGTKVHKEDVKPEVVAREIERALGSALVHLAPSTTTAIKVGTARQSPEELQANVEAVAEAMVERYVPQKWRNLRAVHIKGPETAALPIWMTDELWADEQDVLEEAPKANEGKKRKHGALTEGSTEEVIEVPGPDGKMRRLEKPISKRKSIEAEVSVPIKKRKSESAEDLEAKENEKAEKAARKEALKKQKEAARADTTAAASETKKSGKKVKA